MCRYLNLLLFLHSITIVNDFGAEECVATPTEIEVKILDYKSNKEPFASLTVDCGINVILVAVNWESADKTQACFMSWSKLFNRRATISTYLQWDAVYDTVSKTSCKGDLQIWIKELESNPDRLSLKISVHVAFLAFVCRSYKFVATLIYLNHSDSVVCSDGHLDRSSSFLERNVFACLQQELHSSACSRRANPQSHSHQTARSRYEWALSGIS